jgi:tRNA(His) guanylyltransferase
MKSGAYEMSDGLDLGDRMKRYEKIYNYRFTPRSCVIVRVDGRSFHTFLKYAQKPFDERVINAMASTMKEVAAEMQGFKVSYTQSDECSFLISDFDELNSEGWFNYELNKIVSISASAFTAYFNDAFIHPYKVAMFDARAFIIPREEVPNYFIWRQRDWERNSLQMFARSFYSHKELHQKNTADIHEMLHTKGANWAMLSDQIKNGSFYWKDGRLTHHKEDYESLQQELSNIGLII